jgi:hypothetical protein
MKRRTLWFLALAMLVASWPAVVGASPPPDDRGWWAEYYANPGLFDSPELTRYEEDINYDWGRGAPAPGLPADHFSVRWTRTTYFNAGTYKFCVTVDDGVRVWVDGHLIIDQWKVQGATTYCANKQLSGGDHRVQMAYFENLQHAVAKLDVRGRPTLSSRTSKPARARSHASIPADAPTASTRRLGRTVLRQQRPVRIADAEPHRRRHPL